MKKNNSFLSAAVGAGLAAGAAYLYHKQKNREQRGDELMPVPQMKLEKELVKRMPDMIYYDRFQLAVQPVIDLETGGIVGGEVLSRLDHPEQGLIFPDKFLPAVEEAGLYPKFDHYIFRKTCALMRRLLDQGVELQYLSCNFSRMTLSEKSAATRLSKIADEFGLAHDCLAVEITEREKESDSEQFCENLIQIKKAGFRIFVDDLGAGVTSVRDLWSYPVDVVKIDRSLLLSADDDQGRTAYRGLRNLAVDLGCKVLCEGVETEQQHRFVLEAGCHYGQGFLFYRPMETEQFLYLMGGKR
ncbi:MAG: EAL domain-containing protein [Oscillospiraceae bacterium]|nr:EAL domain-containing protein [Oscillospiraceae bacterium]